MKQFKIKPDGFKEIKKQLLLGALPIVLIAVFAGIAISSINSKAKETDVSVLPFIIPLAAVSIGVGLYKGVNRQKRLFESYTLTLTSNMISRDQHNTPTVSVYFNDIKEIVKSKNGSFTIKGRDAPDIISVPAQVDNYPELEAELDKIKPIVTKSAAPLLQKYQSLLPLLTIGLMLCVYTVTDKIIVVVSGTLLTTLMLWSFYEVRRSKNIDDRTKRSTWWILVVVASVIAVMITKLTASTES